MPYRTFPVWTTILGVCTIIVLFVFRVNLRRVADTGPLFLRRLILAGMMCLWGFGIVGPGWAEDPGRWDTFGKTWQEAQEISSGKRGPFPFNREGKKKILQELADLNTIIDSLATERVISGDEAELLKLDLQELTRGVEGMRPTELEAATCYEPMMFTPELDSLARLEKRLPLISRLEPGKISPEVWNRVTIGLQKDLAVLTNPDHIARLKDDKKAQAAELAAKVQKEIDRLGQKSIPVTPEQK